MTKNYTKNTWVDELLGTNERYDIKDDGGTPIHANVQIGLISTVTQAGTAVDADKMNNIEDGVDTIDTALSDRGLLHVLTSPLTSTSYDGDLFSTTAKTLIDLSAVFGVPAGVKAILVRLTCRDTASSGISTLYTLLSPNNTVGVTPLIARPSGLPNNYYAEASGICPCDANGDVYIQISASGTNSMTVIIQIWGYWL